MRTRNAALVGALCVGLSMGLVACGGEEDPDAGTNGVGKLKAAAIQERARDAARGAGAVHLSGNVVSQGRTYRIDVRLKQDGGSGKVTSGDVAFELLRVGEELFVKGDAAFWARGGTGARPGGGADPVPAPGAGASGKKGKGDLVTAAQKLNGKYVKVPSGDPAYRQLRGFTDKNTLLDGLLGLHGKLLRGDHGTVGSTRSIRLTAGDAQGSGGVLDVSLDGTPYPLRLRRAGGAGEVDFAEWGKEFPLRVPEKGQTLDYGKRLPAGG
ncbi:hypothetical protein [Streptomyces mobaraensis]|uniref:Lipoprotein n=1 Tax=Streptomyces mobaraensis (strain ATCC 29032 / DSM 40847 / JCM 4168 / NBRC 13819 / NCIMB 11159 / IPCR 16-22) TaxID=1223523 RepID=M3BXH6_STRM1|nr:hypothetical protein [Streptomyces mobaraensis]EME96455.1 lipoprotein [Streptomyces mobaraensis NBRC 13819 = DSM 40847]